MAMVSHRLRRAITVVSSLTRLTFVTPKSESALISASSFLRPSAEEWPLTAPRWSESTARMFSSTRQYKLYKEGDEITPDSVLFEGCDYNHWLITMDFPKDNPPSSEEMIATYEQTCAKGLGISLEEAKTKIYACSTTTYQGFQAIMTEEESDKFKDIPGVVFILPDSYIDPVNKEYGGDKYENGVITPRPPPVQYGRSRPRDRSRNFDQPRFDRQANPSQNFQGNPQNRQPMPPAQGDGRGYGPPQNFPSQQQNYGPSGQGGYPGGQGSTRPPYQGNFSQRAPGSYNQGAPGNFNTGAPGNFNPGAPGNFNPGAPGNFNSGAPGNFNSGAPGNFNQGAPGNFNQGAPGNFNQGAPGNFNQGAPGNFNPGAPGNFNPGAPGNFNPGAPGNFNPGAPGNFSQGAPGNNNQGPQGNYYPQGGNRNYGPQGGNYGQPGNPGYGQGYAGQGPAQGFPQNDQNHAAEDWRNNNTMGQPGTDRGKF